MGLLSFARGGSVDRIRADFEREAEPHFREIYRAALRTSLRDVAERAGIFGHRTGEVPS